MTDFTIALAGNPNAGKSTIFNALTGAHQHVGNWPGKTVEKKEGRFSHNGLTFNLIDLPGTYSLSAYSLEEQIARDFIIKDRPALVVNVVDAANLERNLYLTTQILETGIPTIVVLNMMDIAGKRGFYIDTQRMSRLLGGVPVVSAAARQNMGLEAIKQAIAEAVSPPPAGEPGDTPTRRPAAQRVELATPEVSQL